MAKRQLPVLQHERVRLRPLEERDLPATLAWRNRDDIRTWFLTSAVITPAQHREWYARYLDRDDDFVFVIEELESLKRPVGQVSLYRVDWFERRAEFGRLMIGDPAAAGQGLARMATQCVIDYAFSALALRELSLEVTSGNTRAIAVYRACGFERIDSRQGVDVMRVTALKEDA